MRRGGGKKAIRAKVEKIVRAYAELITVMVGRGEVR